MAWRDTLLKSFGPGMLGGVMFGQCPAVGCEAMSSPSTLTDPSPSLLRSGDWRILTLSIGRGAFVEFASGIPLFAKSLVVDSVRSFADMMDALPHPPPP